MCMDTPGFTMINIIPKIDTHEMYSFMRRLSAQLGTMLENLYWSIEALSNQQ